MDDSVEILIGPERVDVSGSPASFASIAEDLRAVAVGERAEAAGTAWICRRANDPIRVRVDRGQVDIAGGAQLLSLAAWFEALALRPGVRVDVGWYPGHPYLSENATTLRLACDGSSG